MWYQIAWWCCTVNRTPQIWSTGCVAFRPGWTACPPVSKLHNVLLSGELNVSLISSLYSFWQIKHWSTTNKHLVICCHPETETLLTPKCSWSWMFQCGKRPLGHSTGFITVRYFEMQSKF
jgi:hypothetical protein